MNIIDHLQERYDLFIDENGEYFYKGLVDYIAWVKAQPTLVKIIDLFEKERKEFYSDLDKLAKKVLKELEVSKNELLNRIKVKKIKSEAVLNLLKQLEEHEKGNYQVMRIGYSFKVDPFFVNEKLFEICKILNDEGHGKFVQFFVSKGQRYLRNIYGEYVFARTFNDLWKESNRLSDLRDEQIWRAWELLGYECNIDSNFDRPSHLLKRDKWCVKQVHLFIKEKLSNYQEISDFELEVLLDFDFQGKEVFIVGNREKAWPIQNKNGNIKVNGQVALEMFTNRGRACVENRDNVRSLVRSLSTAFSVSPKKIEANIFVKNDLFGISKMSERSLKDPVKN